MTILHHKPSLDWVKTLSNFEKRNIVFFVPLLFIYGMGLTSAMTFSLLWMIDKGFSLATVGILGGLIPLCISIFGNIASNIGDGTGKRRMVIIGAMVICMICVPMVFFIPPHFSLYILTIIFFVSIRVSLPIFDSMITQMFPMRDNRSFSFLWLRSVTTLGAIFGILIGSYMYDVLGIAILPWISLTIMFTCVILMVWFDDSGIPKHDQVQNHNVFLVTKDLIKVPWFKPFILFNLLYGMGNAFYYGFFTIHLKTLGFTQFEIALTFAVGCVMEILMFFAGRKILLKWRPTYLLAFCGIIAPIRWFLFAQFDSVLAQSMVATMHGITFSLHWSVSAYYIQRNIPASMSSSAQTIYQSANIDLPMTIIIPLCGMLYPIMGGDIFVIGAGITASSVLVAVYMILNKPSADSVQKP